MRIKFSLAWYNLWIGIYVSRKTKKIYICPFFCCVFEISFPVKKRKNIYDDPEIDW